MSDFEELVHTDRAQLKQLQVPEDMEERLCHALNTRAWINRRRVYQKILLGLKAIFNQRV